MKKLLSILIAAFLLAGAGILGWHLYEINRDHSAWLMEDGKTYYIDFHGNRVSGWQEIDGATYCFTEDGFLCTGWHTIDGRLRYFLSDGSPAQGEMNLKGYTYVFDAQGIPHTGWLEENGLRRWFDSQGVMATGPCTVDGVDYVFSSDGTMVTGWHEGRYYLEDGTAALGWLDLDGQRYYFREDGSPYQGWLTQGEYDYYFLEDGTMAVGPVEINGQIRYFTPGGIHIWLVNPWNYLPEDYDPQLVMTENGYRVTESCVEALEKMLEGCRAAGLRPNLISGYRSYWDQAYLYQEKIAEYGYATGKQIVAVPNTSEHQLGLAVDIVDASYRGLDRAQGEKPVQLWLMENCWDYGFILRYPDNTTDITGIIYEPWHYRYVGLEVSLELKELGITLEEYLGDIRPVEE